MPNLIVFCDRYEFTNKSLRECFDMRIELLPSDKYEIYMDEEGQYKNLNMNMLVYPFMNESNRLYYASMDLPVGPAFIMDVDINKIKADIENYADNFSNVPTEYINLMNEDIQEHDEEFIHSYNILSGVMQKHLDEVSEHMNKYIDLINKAIDEFE